MAHCFLCNEQNELVLETHHKIPQSRGGRDRDDNTVVLCANCHTLIERIYNKQFWKDVNAQNTQLFEKEDRKTEEELNDEAEDLF